MLLFYLDSWIWGAGSSWGLVDAPADGMVLLWPSLQSHRGCAALLLAGEALELPALLFGGRRGPPGECSLPWLEVGGSSWGSSCSARVVTGAAGGLPPTAAGEVPGSSSKLGLPGLLEGAGPGAGVPPREAAGWGTPAGLPSCPPAGLASCQPRGLRASPLRHRTAMFMQQRARVAARRRRGEARRPLGWQDASPAGGQ